MRGVDKTLDLYTNTIYYSTTMKSLTIILKETGVSKYSVLKVLGKDPQTQYNHINLKLRGEVSIAFKDLEVICKHITEKTGEELRPENVAWEPKLVYLK